MQNATEVQKISDSTLKELQALIGGDLAYLIAIDSNNNITPLSPASVPAEVGSLAKATPLQGQITSLNTITLGTSVGGCCQWIFFNGNWYCIRQGC